MPLGIVIILILVVLIIFGYSESILYTIALSKIKAVIFLLLLAFFYTIRPITIESVTVYWLPYLSLLIYGLYLFSKLEFILRNVLLSIISSFFLFLLSQKVLPQPIGHIYEPFLIYALLLTILNILFSYGKRSVIFNSVFSIIIFNTLMIFTETYNNILPPDAFSAICIAALVSYFPVSLLADKKIKRYGKRLFQTESSNELIYKRKSRKW